MLIHKGGWIRANPVNAVRVRGNAACSGQECVIDALLDRCATAECIPPCQEGGEVDKTRLLYRKHLRAEQLIYKKTEPPLVGGLFVGLTSPATALGPPRLWLQTSIRLISTNATTSNRAAQNTHQLACLHAIPEYGGSKENSQTVLVIRSVGEPALGLHERRARGNLPAKKQKQKGSDSARSVPAALLPIHGVLGRGQRDLLALKTVEAV